MIKKIRRFFHEVRIELKKVNWPSRRELTVFTAVVIVVILIIGAFFWVLDTGFTAALKLIIR
ncbi:MAG: preprotein translocase subunit SecE [Dethiobacteria bacterium]